MNTLSHKIDIPLLGLGTYMLRGRVCINTIRAALDIGYRHIDTAEFYGNEEEIGQALMTSSVPRDQLFLTTKVWPCNFYRDAFLTSAEQSLRRLQTDYVDLLLLHWPNNHIPLAEPLDALATLMKQGKVRYGGVSNFSVAQIAESQRIAGAAIACTQVKCHYGVVPRDIIEYTAKHAIAFTAYSPLASGRTKHKHLDKLARKYGKTAFQLALRWLTQQGIAVIPKTCQPTRLQENFLSSSFSLDEADIDWLGRL